MQPHKLRSSGGRWMMEWLSMLQQFDSFLIMFFGGGFSFLTGLIWKQLKNRNVIRQKEQELRKEEKELVDSRLKALEFSNVAILHNKIYRQCAEHLEEGFISIDDLDDLGYLFKAYKSLGGNGTGETLYNKVSNLPNKKLKVGI